MATNEKSNIPMLDGHTPFDQNSVEVVKAFNSRWYILAVYVYYATISCFQWVEYSIVSNIVMRYYQVSLSAVDWTGVMFMIVWPIFVFPSSFLIDKLVSSSVSSCSSKYLQSASLGATFCSLGRLLSHRSWSYHQALLHRSGRVFRRSDRTGHCFPVSGLHPQPASQVGGYMVQTK